ncbi:MAG: endonuclease III domain-containing protein [Sulfolobus sp.]
MCSIKEIYDKLKGEYLIKEEEYIAYLVCNKEKDLFKTLVATILSQNSTDKAAIIAYQNLDKSIGVYPDILARTEIDKIKERIRVTGLANSKARYIKNVANAFLSLDKEIFNDCERAREFLLSIGGVGEKTADVVLLTCLRCRVFPIDTHIRRVMSRLGIFGEKPSYKKISEGVKLELNPEELLHFHHLLIAHGRRVCKAKKPLCERCVLKYCCEYYNRLGKS